MNANAPENSIFDVIAGAFFLYSNAVKLISVRLSFA
jgi:hypothetical protein